MSAQVPEGEQIYRMSQVEGAVGVSRSTVYNRLDPTSKHFDARFPQRVRLGNNARCVGWLRSEIEAYLEILASNR